MKTTDRPESRQRVISMVWGTLLTMALMIGFTLALLYAYVLALGNSSIASGIAVPFIVIGTAAGGAVGVRVAGLRWQQTIVAALLSALGLIAISRIASTPLFPGPWIPEDSGITLDIRSAAIFLVVGGAGVFLLSLFDPVVRRAGTAPNIGKLALVAFFLVLLSMLADYLLSGGFSFGLLTMVIGSFLSAGLAGIGLVLVLVNLTVVGAWIGSLGIVLEIFSLVAWWLLGSPWFP